MDEIKVDVVFGLDAAKSASLNIPFEVNEFTFNVFDISMLRDNEVKIVESGWIERGVLTVNGDESLLRVKHFVGSKPNHINAIHNIRETKNKKLVHNKVFINHIPLVGGNEQNTSYRVYKYYVCKFDVNERTIDIDENNLNVSEYVRNKIGEDYIFAGVESLSVTKQNGKMLIIEGKYNSFDDTDEWIEVDDVYKIVNIVNVDTVHNNLYDEISLDDLKPIEIRGVDVNEIHKEVEIKYISFLKVDIDDAIENILLSREDRKTLVGIYLSMVSHNSISKNKLKVNTFDGKRFTGLYMSMLNIIRKYDRRIDKFHHDLKRQGIGSDGYLFNFNNIGLITEDTADNNKDSKLHNDIIHNIYAIYLNYNGGMTAINKIIGELKNGRVKALLSEGILVNIDNNFKVDAMARTVFAQCGFLFNFRDHYDQYKMMVIKPNSKWIR